MITEGSGPLTVHALLQAMGRGDRQAAAEFVICYGPQIRRRIRGKLRVQMRRVFDSHDILSTLGRRLDVYVHRGQFEPRSEGELWSLVFTIAERSVVEKARIFHLLTACDSDTARESSGGFDDGERLSDEALNPESEFEHLLMSIVSEQDRQIARQWALGHSSDFIAAELGLTAAQVRQRWIRTRDRLREQFVEQRS